VDNDDRKRSTTEAFVLNGENGREMPKVEMIFKKASFDRADHLFKSIGTSRTKEL
jgi:hypothetical protein